MRIVLSVSAKTDLQETLTYYRAPSQLADVFSHTFERGVRHLEDWPFTGHRRRDLSRADVCFWYEEPYYLVFRYRKIRSTSSRFCTLHAISRPFCASEHESQT